MSLSTQVVQLVQGYQIFPALNGVLVEGMRDNGVMCSPHLSHIAEIKEQHLGK
jgi:hypothetical protein